MIFFYDKLNKRLSQEDCQPRFRLRGNFDQVEWLKWGVFASVTYLR